MSLPNRKPRNTWEWLYKYSSIWRSFIAWSKTVILPGCQGVSMFEIMAFVDAELGKDDILTRANAIAYSFFLALFPVIIALFSLLAYLPIYENVRTLIDEAIMGIMPGSAGTLLLSSIRDLLTIQRGGLLSLGFGLTLFFASNGVLALMHGFDKQYRISFKRRHPLVKRLVAIELTFLMFIMLIASVILVILGNTLIGIIQEQFNIGWATTWMISSLRWLVIITLYYSFITLIYRIGSSTLRPMAFFSPGTTIASFGTLASSYVFSFYVDNFGNYNKVYGSIGAIIVLMLWLQLNAVIILLGFEINTSILVSRDLRDHKGRRIASKEPSKEA